MSIRFFSNVFFIVSGIFLAAFGIESFLIPNQYLDGGVTGVSMLVSRLTGVDLYLLLLPLNIPFLFFGWKSFGREFVLRCLFSIIGLSLVLFFFNFPVLSNDKVLGAVFGGILLGSGIGFAIRGESVLDGTEIAAIFFSRKTFFTIGGIILVFNSVLFLTSGFIFGVDTALYSVLTYIFASKSANFIIRGIEEYSSVMVISQKNEAIKNYLLNELGVGITVYKGETGVTSAEQDIVFCVVTRFEVPKIRSAVEKIDSNAFIIVHAIDDVQGGLVKTKFKRVR